MFYRSLGFFESFMYARPVVLGREKQPENSAGDAPACCGMSRTL
jgi:hypothetical protein